MGTVSFQRRLILVYSLFVTILVVMISSFYFFYSFTQREEKIREDLVNRGEKMASQLDTVLSTMDFVTIDLISQWEFMPALATLYIFDRDVPENNSAIINALMTVEKSLYRYSIMRDFHRVSVITPEADFFTNNFSQRPVQSQVKKWIDENPMLEILDSKNGKILIIPPYFDPWTPQPEEKVFSLMRAVVGQNENEIHGYIEVQNPYSIIENIFHLPQETAISINVTTREGGSLYQNGREWDVPESFTFTTTSKYSQITIDLKISGKEVFASLYSFILLALSGNAVILILSLLFIRIFTLQLTKPLEKLTRHINSMDLGTLPHPVDLKSSHNEIEALNFAFSHLQNRLNESIKREIVSHSLQIQANFDSLQAQVNPHFLFNILNVISSMGMESENMEICEMCTHIASILRYSTSTQQRDSTIGHELDHVKDFLILLKKRYEHKLSYHFEVDERIMELAIPKIILQPLVENSVDHSFQKGRQKVDVQITGGLLENDRGWYLEILDDGCGIDRDKMDRIHSEIRNVREKTLHKKEIVELNLGGLGLVNTYLRLLLYFGDHLEFIIENRMTGGVRIMIARRETLP